MFITIKCEHTHLSPRRVILEHERTMWQGMVVAGVNKIVENGAHFYGGIIQPLLRHAGVDTSGADTALHGAYTGYSHLRDAANKIDGMIN